MSIQIDSPLANAEQLSQSEKDAITCAILRACDLTAPPEASGLADSDDWIPDSPVEQIMSSVARISPNGSGGAQVLQITESSSEFFNLIPEVSLVGGNVVPFERPRARRTPPE